jgi:outer membrane protein assembly factor BamB
MNKHRLGFLLLASALVVTSGCSGTNSDPAGPLTQEETAAQPEPLESELLEPEPAEPRAAEPEFRVDSEKKTVTRQAADGPRWSVQLPGDLGTDLVSDAERVYFSHNKGVTALDKQTGTVVWHSKGPSYSLLLHGGLLLAVDTHGPFVARAAATGAISFRVRLPDGLWDEPIREVAGLFLVQTRVWRGKGNALLIDGKGQVLHRFACGVVDGKLIRNNRVFLNSYDVVGVAPNDKERWKVSLESDFWEKVQVGGGLIDLGADLLAFRYMKTRDSGVELIRLDSQTGKVRWRATCAPLWVGHSIYIHRAAVTVKGERLIVTSKASGGTFVETLDLRSGRLLKRAAHRRW